MRKSPSLISWLIPLFRREVILQNPLRKFPKVVKIKGVKIPILKDKLSQFLQVLIFMGFYEKEELKLVQHLLDRNDIVMELGTGLGLISSYCAKKIGSQRVFTYEANPALETYIRHTYRLNGVSPNLTMCVLGERSGEQTFYVSKDFICSSTVLKNSQDRPVMVPVKSFNEEAYRINPTFLILDIEGGEYELLKFADLHTIEKIVIEVHPNAIGKKKVDFVMSQLKNAGFYQNKKLSLNRELVWERHGDKSDRFPYSKEI